MKQKSQIMLKFLFYAILGLLIFIPIVMWGTKFLSINDKGKDSFLSLVQEMEDIKNEELISVAYYLDKNDALIGFSQEAEQFSYTPSQLMLGNVGSGYSADKPQEAGCREDKACVCLCRDIEFEINEETGNNEIKCENTLCHEFTSVNILNHVDFENDYEAVPNEYFPQVDTTIKAIWDGGFMYSRGDATRFGLGSSQLATRTLYVEKVADTLHVCATSDCFTDLIKERTAKERAITTFRTFSQSLQNCLDQETCSVEQQNLPDNYYIFYSATIEDGTQAERENGIYLLTGEQASSFAELDIVEIQQDVQAHHGIIILETSDPEKELSTQNLAEVDFNNAFNNNNRLVLSKGEQASELSS